MDSIESSYLGSGKPWLVDKLQLKGPVNDASTVGATLPKQEGCRCNAGAELGASSQGQMSQRTRGERGR